MLLPDSGRGYLSKIFNDDWMTNHGFLTQEAPTLGEVLASKSTDIPPIVYLQPEDTVAEAIAAMSEYSISQVVIAQGSLPLSAAEIKGAINESQLNEIASDREECGGVMSHPLQFAGIGTSISTVQEVLSAGQKLLIFKEGRPVGVVSHSDVIAYLNETGRK